jgi:TRAP-type mannitol/chloroaromatic compound transport system permease small subunit
MDPGRGGLPGFATLIDRLSDLVGRIALWLLGAMILIGALNAVARYLGRFTGVHLSSNAYIELQWYLFSIVFLLGAAYGVRHDAHVRVDILYGRLGPRGRAWIDLLGTVLFLIPFSVFMILVSYPAVAASWRIREVSPDPGGLPRYPIKALILVAFGLLVLQGLAEVVKQVAVLRGAPVRTRPAHHRPEEV